MTGDNSWGDPSAAGTVRKSLNLDKPFYLQYGLWLEKVLRGDLGVSFISGQNVPSEILQRIPVNFQMIAHGHALYHPHRYPRWDPVRVPAILLVRSPGALCHHPGIFDSQFLGGDDRGPTGIGLCSSGCRSSATSLFRISAGNIKCMLLPGFVLGLSTLAFVTRLARSSSLDTLRQDYVRTARAKGASEPVILFVHVMKNSLIPVVTVLGVQVGIMIGGFVLTEEVFVLPGVGSLLLMAIQQRDLMMATGGIMFLAVVNVVVNLLVDITYTFLDPRIKY